MKTDDQVLDEATGIIKDQWCRFHWHNGEEGEDARYCAVGAIEKAVGARLAAYDTMAVNEPNKAKVAQVARIAGRVWNVIADQYPEAPFGTSMADEFGHDFAITWSLENFNDEHTREEMLAIFEKARHGEMWPGE